MVEISWLTERILASREERGVACVNRGAAPSASCWNLPYGNDLSWESWCLREKERCRSLSDLALPELSDLTKTRIWHPAATCRSSTGRLRNLHILRYHGYEIDYCSVERYRLLNTEQEWNPIRLVSTHFAFRPLVRLHLFSWRYDRYSFI
jgi:hypothetical protein